jgi:RNA polymerase sigma-70 factor (ECF subfamily)
MRRVVRNRGKRFDERLALLATVVLDYRRGGRVFSAGRPAPSPAGPSPGSDFTDDDPDRRRVRALVELAKAGDAEAFGQLYDRYAASIFRFAYYRVGSRAHAEDVTSETFFRALRSLSTFRWEGRDFGSWLVTITRNLIIDHYKSSRARLEAPTDDLTFYAGVTEGPEDEVITGLTNQELRTALGQLAVDQQECLVLRFLNGYSIAETAAALGRSDGAVKQLQLRAIRNLSKLLPQDPR